MCNLIRMEAIHASKFKPGGGLNTNLKSPGLVIGLLKQKPSLFVIRSLENQFL